MLTTFDVDEMVFTALKMGVSGFLLKDTVPAELVSAIHAVAGGRTTLSESVTRTLIDAAGSTPPNARRGRVHWKSWASSPSASAKSLPPSPADCRTPRSPSNFSSACPPSRPTSGGCWRSWMRRTACRWPSACMNRRLPEPRLPNSGSW